VSDSDPGKHALDPGDTRQLGRLAWPAYRTAVAVGIAGLLLALMAAMLADHGMVRFAHAYTTSYAYWLSIALGGLFFVIGTHLFKGGWCVVVRRPAEVLGASMPYLAILFVPILVFVIAGNGSLYEWAQPYSVMGEYGSSHAAETDATGGGHAESSATTILPSAQAAESDASGDSTEGGAGHGDDSASHGSEGAHAGGGEGEHGGHGMAHYVKLKQPYLSYWFFIVRWVLYFGIWAGLGLWFWRQSTQQDRDGNVQRTWRMEKVSAPAALLFGLSLTFASFDLLMTLDPLWYSTIFGVYYFAGCFLGAVAVMILGILGLQQFGFFRSVNVEHFHDLGKLLFAFVFFWGYIAFSQFMLYWYANLPPEIAWYQVHGFTTQPANAAQVGWGVVGIVLLVAHLLIPFAGLLSYKAKRNTRVLAFWAVWLLVIHWVDMIWLVMPEVTGRGLSFGAMDIFLLIVTFAGVGGLTAAGVIRTASQHSLVSMGDPRLSESLAFENH
jgi:hypothetical protein